ncbi:hypothetical protein N1851_006687 [Merluccius polli]|uniref:Uncharacterized protein n=1 Tax=Merluccius polli TaxID=89951 RepID=A0AA47N417_MERPO|nr:hypothetical protein N1851_006687 [Merluccius polli]
MCVFIGIGKLYRYPSSDWTADTRGLLLVTADLLFRVKDATQENIAMIAAVHGKEMAAGHRHCFWPRYWLPPHFTVRSHKLVIPPESPDKKFVLIVGDSHLRAIVDGVVQMPEEPFSFGVMSTPGAAASALRTEVLNAVLPRVPDAVCLLAPSNNLTASRTIDEASVDYVNLLRTIRSRWPNVFVVDFPPRLNCEVSYQDLLRQEYHCVSARMGVKYFSAVEYFPHTQPELWSRDGVHLSDDQGMGILVQLLWSAAMKEFETPPPAPRVSPRPSPPVRTFSPKLVVTGEAPAPRSPDPFQWQLASHGHKAEESSFPLNPVWFSSTVLDAMEEVSPSNLSSPVDYQPSPRHKRATKGHTLVAYTPPPPPPGWITPNQDLLEFGHINPLLFTGCKEGQAQDTFPNHTTLDHYRCRLRPSLPS